MLRLISDSIAEAEFEALICDNEEGAEEVITPCAARSLDM